MVTLATVFHPTWGQPDPGSRPQPRPHRHPPDLRVYEGVGVGELRLGDPADSIERILGEADASSEHNRRYAHLGVSVQIYEDKVYMLHFNERFPGTLYASGLGIGDTLADLERVYGPVLERREVADHHAWQLDRVLLVRRGGPQYEAGEASKIEYYDLGMSFFLDIDERLLRFSLLKATGYALRPKAERTLKNTLRVGVPSAAPDERAARWKASKIRDWSVREGVGFAALEFGDPPAHVESVLGPPDSGSEVAWNYPALGVSIAFSNGRASAFFFRSGKPTGSYFTASFSGKLAIGGVGIGDRLEDVEAAYGVVLDRRKVHRLTESVPSRVLAVCDECTANVMGESSRLHYRDLDLYFDFNDQERIVGFGLTRALSAAKPSRTGTAPED